MTAKEYLSSIRQLEKEISELQASYEKLSAKLYHSPANMQDIQMKNKNSSKASIEEILLKMTEYHTHISKEWDNLIKLRMEANAIINKMQEPVDRRLLRLRYIECEKWKTIAEILGYEIRQVYRMHIRAIEKFEKTMQKYKICQ